MKVVGRRLATLNPAILSLLLGGYFSANIVLRWMRYPLFHDNGAYGGIQATPLELGYLVLGSCLPAAVGALVLYVATSRVTSRFAMGMLFLVTVVALGFFELDQAWYGLSNRHANFADAQLFLTKSWRNYFGIQVSDVRRFGVMLARHVAVVGAIFVVSTLRVRERVPLSWLRPRPRIVMLAAAAAVLVDLLGAAFVFPRQRERWSSLANRNPLAINLLPPLVRWLSGDGADLDAANQALSRLGIEGDGVAPVIYGRHGEPNPLAGPFRTKQPDVVVVVIEGLSVGLVDDKTMPVLSSLAKRSFVGARHYSTSNITEFGVLGLVFASPLGFFQPGATVPAQSPFVDGFNRHGYETRVISTDLTGLQNMGRYLGNFSRPWIEEPNLWNLIPLISEELKRPGPNFVLTHYFGTHYPYLHDPAYVRFLPEVSDRFDYASWNLLDYREPIRNRYRNCLAEADAWLGALVETIDSANTIVVITGDHGEEFFENGRLSHASSLSEPQIRTPFLIRWPGGAARTDTSITSHLDVMPTLADLLGWDVEFKGLGRSMLTPGDSRTAFVVQNSGLRLPNTWAVVTEAEKSVVTRGPDGNLRITELFDVSDRKVVYRRDPARWTRNLGQILALQQELKLRPDQP